MKVYRLLPHELRRSGTTPAVQALLKREAQDLAKVAGWNKSDVMLVALSRFQLGWVIADDHLNVLCTDGEGRSIREAEMMRV